MNLQFELLIQSFMESNIGCSQHFLSDELVKGLQQKIKALYQEGQMLSAGIGDKSSQAIDSTIRKDKIYWLDKKSENSVEKELFVYIEKFIAYLNSTCYTGINGYEFHYAWYEKGSFYKVHKDQFANNQDRKFSLIMYLNDFWTEENGGQLLVYQNERVQKILPQGGTAVFFDSQKIEHEVSLSNRPRMSITGWLKRT